MKIDLYTNSTALFKIRNSLKRKQQPKLAFLDIDSTLHHSDSGNKTDKARKVLEEKDYVIIFNTSRTEELVMSEKERNASKLFQRPAPHLGQVKFKQNEVVKSIYYYVDPQKIEPKGVLDPDIIIGSTGTAIWIKQITGGYKPDYNYQKSFRISSTEWRNSILELLKKLKKTETFNISHIEDQRSYEKNRSNVFPPDYRVQTLFTSIVHLKSFVKKMQKIKSNFLTNIRITNDSKPSHGKYVLYLKPKNASKIHAQEFVIKNVLKNTKVKRKDLNIFIAGDSWPDLIMGIKGESETETFLLVGGSRLFKDLTTAMHHSKKNIYHYFSGESLMAIGKRFIPTTDKGLYFFRSSRHEKVKIILGDERYPGTVGVETVLAYLNNL